MTISKSNADWETATDISPLVGKPDRLDIVLIQRTERANAVSLRESVKMKPLAFLILALAAIACHSVNADTCSDGSVCDDTQTCCQLQDGDYGCCPYEGATCCSDEIHCCPQGYVCDLKESACRRGNSVRPLASKVPSLR